MEDYARSVALAEDEDARLTGTAFHISRRYNVSVPPSAPRPRKENSRILSAEATGVLIVALLILVITVVRYWRNIPWGAH
jgi:hypothetical protein